MPIIIGNRPIFRVKFTEANIREVERGDSLKWGLYEITYVNSGPNTVSIGFDNDENIPDYVWGYPKYSENDFYLYVPDDAAASEAEYILGSDYAYKSHSEGWYDNKDCVDNSSSELYYIPAITRDFHRDLTLYCKWRQRRYSWNGVYGWDKDTVSTVGHWVWVKD